MAAKDLRSIVAGLAGVAPAEVNADFSLQTAALASSIKKAMLIASIRKHLGVECMQAGAAKNFAELERMIAAKAGLAAAAVDAPPAAPPEFAGMRVGVDVERVDALPETADYETHSFYTAHFTPAERAYCAAQAAPRQHFAARWAAKEALYKCDASLHAAPFDTLEIGRENSGAPFLSRLEPGGLKRLPHALSLSHTETSAVAFVALPAEPLWRRLLTFLRPG
jgi:holo-[acyl-carrier protein] synthase